MTGLSDRVAGLSPAEKARLLERLREKKQAAAPAGTIPPRDRALDPPPLSFSQQRLWFLDRLRPGDPLYNIPTPLLVEGQLDVAALHRALAGIVDRHEALRTTFALHNDAPVQIIAPRISVDLPLADLSGLGGRAEAEAARLLLEDELRPFDLATGPLLRATLLRLATDRHLLSLILHHIVSDGWSGSVLIRDLVTLYGGGALDPLSIQYADFAVWQRGQLGGAELERRLAPWRARLAGAPAVLELPSDRPRGSTRTSRGGSAALRLEPAVAGPLRELARREEATAFIVLLAAFQALLHRLTGRDDLCVGSPVANRGNPEIAHLIGFFVNTLVLRGDLSGDPRFAELVGRLRPVAFEAFAHQDVPFEKLVEELRPERETGRPPLVQVSLMLQNFPPPAGEVRGLRVILPGAAPPVSKLDLTLGLEEQAGGFSGVLLYSTDLFDQPTAERLAAAFATLTAAACADPGRRLAELPLLSEIEQAELLREWNDTAAPGNPALIPKRFARQAALHPEKTALVAEEIAWTWGELAGRVSELESDLRAMGVGPEVRVAKVADRTPETIAAMLAVLTAGGTWVPLDPGLPEARRNELVEASGALLLHGQTRTTTDDHGPVLGVRARPWSSMPVRGPLPETAAYLIFTSGSTGAPKGVVVEHRQLRHYVDAITRLLGPAPDREGLGSWAVVSTLAADLGHTALFPALCGGGTLHLMSPERALDPEAFADYAGRHRIDALKIVPSHLAALLAGTRPEAVLPRELLVLGGEAASWELAESIAETAPDLRLLNHYGPTETTVGAIAGPIEISLRPRPRRPPIGRPLANVEAHLLDRNLRLVPAGVPGELFLGGGGVARGYLGQPGLTAERFIPAPRGDRLYRTGDLARRLPDGSLEFLGRADGQVKIRGFRVEPGEVEAALARHPQVAEAVVLAISDGSDRSDGSDGLSDKSGGELRLAAYVVPHGEVDAEELRAWLQERLPAVLVPAGWVLLDALPLTANGKVDRQALEKISPPAGRGGSGAVPPRTGLEREIAAVWCEVLGLERAGVGDSFFDLGGHSLLLPRVQLGLREKLGLEVPLLAMFAHPTVAALAAWLESRDEPAAGETQDDSRERVRRQRQGLEMQRRRLAQRRSV